MVSNQTLVPIEIDPLTLYILEQKVVTGLARWAEKEKGDRYSKCMDIAFQLYLFEVARSVEKQKKVSSRLLAFYC